MALLYEISVSYHQLYKKEGIYNNPCGIAHFLGNKPHDSQKKYFGKDHAINNFRIKGLFTMNNIISNIAYT